MPFLVVVLLGVEEGAAQTSPDPVAADAPTVVAFVKVAVVSMQSAVVVQGQNVLVQGERILSIGPAETLPVPAGTTVIDGSGRYLLPGLVDMHVHVGVPFEDGPLYLNAGVTTVLSLGTQSASHEATRQERARSRTPDFVGPAMYSVGPQISGGESSDEAERIVRETVEQAYDLVKVHGDVAADTFARLHDTARRLDIKVTGHAQRRRGMHPVYAYGQDLAHVEEYLYAAFNPRTPGFVTATFGSLFVLVLALLMNLTWDAGALWGWVRRRRPSMPFAWCRPVKTWVRVCSGLALMSSLGLALSVTDPFPGLYAGTPAAVGLVGLLMLLVALAVGVLTVKAGRAWRSAGNTVSRRVTLMVVVGLAWTFVACAGYLAPRTWRTTEAGLARIARDTAEAGIWVTPNLVTWDYSTRQSGDEFAALVQRPEMRYLRPGTREQWISNNEYRRAPAVLRPMQGAARRGYGNVMSRLVGKFHEAGVPLLAGSDAVGPPGVLPGSSLHEELSLLVRAGLTPYEALRTATVNAAAYLNAETEFGRIEVGLRADLVLLAENPLDEIDHTRMRIGVMKGGRWFSSDELEGALERLAEQRN